MNHLSLSASKHLLKPQPSKTQSSVLLLLLNHHFSTDSDPDPNPKPTKQPHEDDSLVTHVVQLLESDEKDWNLDQLRHLLFSDSAAAPSPRSLFRITRRIDTSSKALNFFDYVSENVATSPDSAAAAALLSSSFQAVLELAKREPNSQTRLFDMYKMAKERNIPVNMGSMLRL